MTFLIFIFLCIFGLFQPVFVSSETLASKVKDAAEVLGNDQVSKAVEVLKAIRPETSTSISARVEPVGFLSIDNSISHGIGVVAGYNIDVLIKNWMSDSSFVELSQSYRDLFSSAMRDYAIQVKDEAYTQKRMELHFHDSVGTLVMLSLDLVPHKTKTNTYHWEIFLVRSKFAPAQPYVVVTTSDCNLFSCDRQDEIVYMPATLTDSHINSIINLNIGFIMGFNNYAQNAVVEYSAKN